MRQRLARRRQQLKDAIVAGGFAFAALGTNLTDLVGVQLPLLLLLVLMLALATALYLVLRRKAGDRTSLLEEGSASYYDFFQEWYSQHGRLAIYCTDLEWLHDPRAAPIIAALKRKGDRLTLYLRKANDPLAQELRGNNAVICQIRPGIRTRHRLSLLDNDGVSSIIVRNTALEEAGIAFIQTDSARDPYLIGLAQDLLENCHVQR